MSEGRTVYLGDKPVFLPGETPRPGVRLVADFCLPAARCAAEPLTRASMSQGHVLVSTLPNIRKHACAAQIAELEELAHGVLPFTRIVHVSSDAARWWSEVDLYHGSLRAEAYSLHGVDRAHRIGFTQSFGVAVAGQVRVAHGLFSLEDGVFRVAHVPEQQLGVPDVAAFLVLTALTRGSRAA